MGLNSVDDRIELFVGKGWKDFVGDLFGLDGADTLAHFQHGGILHCHKFEKGVNTSQTSVS